MTKLRSRVLFQIMLTGIASSVGLFQYTANANSVEQFIAHSQLEFSETQESLFRNFIDFTLKKLCPDQFPSGLEAMRTLNESSPLDAMSIEIHGRQPSFLELFKDCEDFSHFLTLCDDFDLKVPEYFSTETLPLAIASLNNPSGSDSFEERIDVANALIRSDIEKDYTPEKLLNRFEHHAQNLTAINELSAETIYPSKAKKNLCTFKGCKKKVSSPDQNPFSCSLCSGNYCAKHYMLEDHQCSSLSENSDPGTTSQSRGSSQPGTFKCGAS